MRKSSSSIAQISIFLHVMVTIHFTSIWSSNFPFSNPPTFVHIQWWLLPFFTDHVLVGQQGLLMGLFSLTINTIVQYQVVIYSVPLLKKAYSRYRAGSPYPHRDHLALYRVIHNKTGLTSARQLDLFTNTFFCAFRYFIFFQKLSGGIKRFLGAVCLLTLWLRGPCDSHSDFNDHIPPLSSWKFIISHFRLSHFFKWRCIFLCEHSAYKFENSILNLVFQKKML